MKLFFITTNKEINNRVFCCYNDALAYSKNYENKYFSNSLTLGDLI